MARRAATQQNSNVPNERPEDGKCLICKDDLTKKKIVDGTLGKVVSVLVSRHLSRALGKKIASRVRLSPVVMDSTHDLDFV